MIKSIRSCVVTEDGDAALSVSGSFGSTKKRDAATNRSAAIHYVKFANDRRSMCIRWFVV